MSKPVYNCAACLAHRNEYTMAKDGQAWRVVTAERKPLDSWPTCDGCGKREGLYEVKGRAVVRFRPTV